MANILYRKQKQQKSLDNGVTWIDTGEYRVGDIIENPSNCSSTDTKQCRWVELDASEGYYCDGNSNSKYTIQVEECTENGLIWTRTGNSKKGNTFIESNSCDCGYSEYRWNLDPYRYECDENSFSKYGVEVYQVGCGDNWQNVEPLQERTTDDIIECYSLDCGMSSNEIILTIEKVDNYSKGIAMLFKSSSDSYNTVYCDYPLHNDKCIDLTDSDTTVTLNVRDYLPCKNVIGIKLLGEGNYSPCNYNTTKIKRVDKMMDTKHFKSFNDMFPSSVEFIDTTYINTENALNMSSMFGYCKNLTSLDVSNFDTSNVNNMNMMFYGCSGLTTLDLSNFNTSNVADMSYMFYNCNGLRELNLSGWDFSNITNDTYNCSNTFMGTMECMFSGLDNCYINLRDTTYENFDKIVSYHRYRDVFSGCTNVTLDLKGFDNDIVAGWQYLVNTDTLLPHLDFVDIISDNIVNTGGTILSCYVSRDSATVKINSTTIDLRDYTASNAEDLATIDLVDYMPITSITFEKGIEVIKEMPDTSNVKYLSFTGVGRTFVIPNKLFNSIENITSMSHMFGGLRLGKEIDWGYLTAPLLTSTDYMFNGCSYVEKIDLSNWNCSIDDWSCMFYGCSSLEEINLSGWDLSNAENNSGFTFYGCDNLKRIILNDVTCETYQKVVNRLITEGGQYYNVDIETNIVLDDCPIEDYTDNDILFTLNTVYQNTCNLKINNKFYSCSTDNGYMVKYLNIDDTVTSLYECFYGIRKYIKNIVNFNIDTSNVTNMGDMFYGCSGLTSLDVSNFDTSNVTNMGLMFGGCSNLTTLDLSNFNTPNVTNTESMFAGCTGLTSLDVSNFDTSNVTNTESMFYNCTSLQTLKIKQGTRDWWYKRLTNAKIQNNVTIIEV